MASYYDVYDSRPRPSRSDEPYPRTGNELNLRPTAATKAKVESSSRGGEKIDEIQNSYSGMSYTTPQNYDSRYHYPPPPPLPAPAGPPPRQTQLLERRRGAYPPQPTCEDEAASLAKESGSQRLLNTVGKDEAVLRGTIDQEPIVEDAPKSTVKQDERAGVSRDSLRPPTVTGVPTPPTSDDEKSRRANRRPSKLNMNFKEIRDEVPEFSKRTASPYAFSKSTASTGEEIPKERYFSPETLLSPPPMESRSRPKTHVYAKSQPSSPVRESSKRSPSAKPCGDYFSLSSGESALDDTDEDTGHSASRPRRRKPSTYPPSHEDAPNTGTKSAVVDFASQPSVEPLRKLNLDSRRNTDTEGTLPTFSSLRVDKTRGPTPLTMSSASSDLTDSAIYSSPTTPQSAADFSAQHSRDSSYALPGAVSPARSATDPQQTTTPPRTPRTSMEFPRPPGGDDSPVSRTSSISGSVSGSRPSSPSPRTPSEASRLPKTELDWGTLLAANAARRTNPTSRLNTLRQESMPSVSRVDNRQAPVPSRNSSLPYPVDDGPLTPTAWMPSERSHQYFPEPRPAIPVPLVQEAKTMSRTASPIPNTTPPGSSHSSRPFFKPRHSAVDLPMMEKQQRAEKPRANESKRVSSFNDPSQAKKDAQALVEKALPKCPRIQPVAGKSDWYTLIGAPSLDFCPDCIDYLERTVFRLSFRKSPPRNLETKVTCALGGKPWVRLAWLLTLQRQRSDLNYLKDIAEIEETTEPCPGDRHAVRSWYGVRDPDGLFVRGFTICYNDVKKIERLLPSLNGIFVPLPHRASYDKQLCAIRPEGNRFSIYLDALVSTHEKALASRRGLDPLPFIELVEKRQRLRECTKDSIILNQLWHYIPAVPELTVCEDCFETVVEPEVKKNKELAMRFNRAVQPAYGETVGSSCQLYSNRMRSVFRRALRGNDLTYLARKARERRDAELRLQDKYREVMRKAKRLSTESNGSQDEERRLDREIRRITDEWQTHWE